MNVSENMDSACRKERLKKLLDWGSDIRKSAVVGDNEIVSKITKIIKETDCLNNAGDLQDRAHNTTEVVMDAQVVQMTHELIGEVMQDISSPEFSEEEWINAIAAMVHKDNNENWQPITEVAGSICRTFKFSPCLLIGGDYSADPDAKIQKERQRRHKSAKVDEVRPENLSQIEKREGDTQNMMEVYKEIAKIFVENKQQPIPYYKLVIDPNNFMNTVDNAFQIAFLARDNIVQITNDDKGLPLLMPLNKQQKTNAPSETTQAICSLDMHTVNQMIKKYNIKRPLLKRNKQQLP